MSTGHFAWERRDTWWARSARTGAIWRVFPNPSSGNVPEDDRAAHHALSWRATRNGETWTKPAGSAMWWRTAASAKAACEERDKAYPATFPLEDA